MREREDDKSNLTTPTTAHEEHWREGGCAFGAHKKEKGKRAQKVETRGKKGQNYHRLTIADRGTSNASIGKLFGHVLGYIDAGDSKIKSK